jgi:hypothetical protein
MVVTYSRSHAMDFYNMDALLKTSGTKTRKDNGQLSRSMVGELVKQRN